MSRALIERRLVEVGARLRGLRDELRVVDEQLLALTDEADDSALRALVSETPLATREHRQAQRHADAMRRQRTEVAGEIQRLESAQDELLDRLASERI